MRGNFLIEPLTGTCYFTTKIINIKHSLHVGWGNFFPVVLLCQFLVLVGNKFWFYILAYSEYNTGILLVFWFWQEIVFGVTYVLSVQYTCAVVSVIWLWRDIVLKMRTPFEFLLGYRTLL